MAQRRQAGVAGSGRAGGLWPCPRSRRRVWVARGSLERPANRVVGVGLDDDEDVIAVIEPTDHHEQQTFGRTRSTTQPTRPDLTGHRPGTLTGLAVVTTRDDAVVVVPLVRTTIAGALPGDPAIDQEPRQAPP